MPRFIDTTNNFDINGEMSFSGHGPVQDNATLIIPNGTVLPTIIFSDGQLFYHTTLGRLYYTNGGAWFYLSPE